MLYIRRKVKTVINIMNVYLPSTIFVFEYSNPNMGVYIDPSTLLDII